MSHLKGEGKLKRWGVFVRGAWVEEFWTPFTSETITFARSQVANGCVGTGEISLK